MIAITSESHAQLFYHDWEITNLFQEPLSKANAHIQLLEERLRQSLQDGGIARSKLYATELALQHALSCRKAFERHLQLEQHESRLLRVKHDKMAGDMDAILTYNEILRQEVEQQQQIIESMAARLNECETTDPSRCPPPAWWESGIWSGAPQDGSGSTTPRARQEAAQGETCAPRILETAVQSGAVKGSPGRGPGDEEIRAARARLAAP